MRWCFSVSQNHSSAICRERFAREATCLFVSRTPIISASCLFLAKCGKWFSLLTNTKTARADTAKLHWSANQSTKPIKCVQGSRFAEQNNEMYSFSSTNKLSIANYLLRVAWSLCQVIVARCHHTEFRIGDICPIGLRCIFGNYVSLSVV